MAYLKDTGSPATYHAELPGDSTLNTTAKTLSMTSGTETTPLKILETDRQWIIIETRNINGSSNLTGYCKYTEDVSDILVDVEAIRSAMYDLHVTTNGYSGFDVTAAHYKTSDICDVYRGDEATSMALASGDINISFTPPSTWVIDDLTPFAPNTPNNNNLFTTPDFSATGNWLLSNSSITISGGKLNVSGIDANSSAEELITLESNAIYDFEITADSMASGGIGRFIMRNTVTQEFLSSDYFYSGAGSKTGSVTNTINANRAGIQFINNTVGVFDDISCIRRT